MAAYRVVSVDMFQTLVNVQSRVPFIWTRILGDAYTPEAARKYAAMLFGLAIPRFSSHLGANGFSTTKEIFAECFTEVFRTTGIACAPEAAARIFADEHGRAASYDDTEEFLRMVSRRYPICLSSDADTDMIAPLLERFSFDRTFISEELRSYKREPNCRMFAALLEHYRVDPREIIHIGDSYADVFGAGQYGITTCWLNRTGAPWQHDRQPDFTISSLSEVPALLAAAEGRAAD